jgi:PAS domain S-box-containing protein
MPGPTRHEAYFQALPGYVTVQDRNFTIVDANERFRTDFGDWEGRRCYQVYKRRAEPCEVCPVAQTFHDGERHASEETVRTQDGRTVSTIVYTKPIRNGTGEVTSVLEVSTDITRIRSLQERLRRSQERYRTLFDEVPCYISIQDAQLNIVDANRAFQEAFGNSLGRKCYEAYKHRAEPCVPCPVQATFDDQQSHSREEVVSSLDGQQKHVLVTTTPIRNGDGDVTGVMEMSADITEVRELQDRLSSLGLLVGSVSHGLKGLLNGLAGGMYLVDSGFARDDDDRVDRGWATVKRNVDRIRTMVSDILYYAKDRTPLWEELDAHELADEVVALAAPRAEETGVALALDVQDGIGSFAGDPQAIRALLTNLVENAVDACRLDRKEPEHRVALDVTGSPDTVRFTVEDNGVGMDDETIEKAFTLFFSSKGSSGTGLGLFIAHKITHAHGGEIALDGAPGEGTRVIVTLPREKSPPNDAEPEDYSHLEEEHD